MTKEERENALHCLKVMIDEEVCEECKLYGTTGTDHCEADCVRVAIEALKKEPRKGRWIDEAEREPWYRCSECRGRVWGSHHKYCPNCGADMREVEK